MSSKKGSRKTILVSGSQILAFDQDSLHKLQANIAAFGSLSWIPDAVDGLPSHFALLCAEFPQLLELSKANEMLQALSLWARTGDLTKLTTSLQIPNLILTPLSVISHLAAYASYRQLSRAAFSADGHTATTHPLADTETVGFCTGLLAALVTSLSGTDADFALHGATAVRLAMLIGAQVDAQDALDGGWTSFSAVWRAPEGLHRLQEILKDHRDEAYVSVRYDENRATVTTARSQLSTLVDKARAAGLTTMEISLSGSFHSERHRNMLERLSRFCDQNPAFCLPESSALLLPCRTDVTATGDYITAGKLSGIALKAMLVEPSNWWETFTSFCSPDKEPATIVTLGSERCIPPSVGHSLPPGSRHIHLADVSVGGDSNPFVRSRPSVEGNENDIAVIGMACQVAGAEDLSEFWKIIQKGESQHTEVPQSRFSFETGFRDADREKKWYGNFIRDYDAFDHKFFKKTPREAASMDPQQRLLMQVAYQAVEQSGYFQKSRPSSADVGCYIGTCAVDYECNVGCHAPNAFSSTGNLRGFIAGKLSHYFGWTGPGLTLDTACSGAAVAVHSACKAILTGECESALAGGVNMITQPLPYQNLAAASFLSPTGQCKPFCKHADGYCRGEGVAAVYLKKRSAAVADGDQIFGIVSGTAVTQNENCTPIFVPNVPSLSGLFQKVLARANLDAQQISYVEAHGTGTPVGDPAEYDSISQIFAKTKRAKAVQVGSAKGLVGHTESTSGLVSMIKVLLMMHENAIPPQASFQTMNPHIKANNLVSISTALRPWDDPFKAALINNYGASGSNASMVVTKPHVRRVQHAGSYPYPFWFAASDDNSLNSYCRKLQALLEPKIHDSSETSLAEVSFNVSRQSNRHLSRALFLSCSTLQELHRKLSEGLKPVEKPVPRPVVLCFGGQVSTFVGLDQALFDGTTILRSHLDQCDQACRSLGSGSIYPGIFQKTAIEDTVKLQLCLFSIQYAAAKSWVDCGVQPSALIGHSFGELTALCVSGALSLRDSVKMISGRAKLIRDEWGPEKGAMMAIEADLAQVQSILQSSSPTQGQKATIACFNGPRSFTLAGSTHAIDAVAKTMSSSSVYSAVRSKRLNVTNAFHSTLVEHLMPSLERMARDLKFKKPSIPVEFATEAEVGSRLGPRYVAEHMRNPVHFNDALQRLSKKYPSSVWLEAGSNSTVTSMAGRALGAGSAGSAGSEPQLFHAVNITTDGSTAHLTSTTMGLWKAGVNAAYWQHHSSQTEEYTAMLLPPYQFDKSRHWLELKALPQTQVQAATTAETDEGLWSFEGYQGPEKRSARFRINTSSSLYREMVSNHLIAQTAPICPATLEVDMAIEALMSLQPDFRDGTLQPQLHNVDNHAPICLDSSRIVWLDFTPIDKDTKACRKWAWKMTSENAKGGPAPIAHVSGQVIFCSVDDVRLQQEFSRYERLVSHQRCADVIYGNDVYDDIVQGQSIYRMFNDVVQYGDMYQGLKRLVGSRSKKESAGRVVKKYTGNTWLDAHLSDCFSQVAGAWVNCMTDRAPGDMYIANGFEKWIRSPKLGKSDSRPEAWDVLACHQRADNNTFLTDVFIFDPRNGALVEIILGIVFAKVSKSSMSKLLSRLSVDYQAKMPSVDPVQDASIAKTNGQVPVKATPEAKGASGSQAAALLPRIQLILAELSGLDAGDIKEDADLADLGIDSLMGMELTREIENAFKCSLAADALLQVLSVQGLVECVRSELGLEAGSGSEESATEHSKASSDDILAQSTAQTSARQSPIQSVIMNGLPDKDHTIIGVNGVNGVNSAKGAPARARIAQSVQIPSSAVLGAFSESKALTDHFLEEHGCDNYLKAVMPLQTELCVALALEAFEQLGSDIRAARPGEQLQRIEHVPTLERLADYLYNMLDKEARLVELNGAHIIRTAVPCPTASSQDILQVLLRESPEHYYPHKLTHFAGSRLADVLAGKSDGVKVIFGSEDGRELASGLYADSPLNKQSYVQMMDFVQRLAKRLPADTGPLRILELGAGTGGTTTWIVPLLVELGIPVEYTFSDLSPSLVAVARKRFGKEFPFMRFQTVDVEKEPPEDLLSSQHMVLASNAVHATHSLTRSLGNIRKTLRADGFIMLLEMTRTLYWVDVIFGLLEGWWLFDDGRKHAIAHQSRWSKDLHSVGYRNVDWTDGRHPESGIQRLIIALNKGDEAIDSDGGPSRVRARQAAVDEYVERYTAGFSAPASSPTRAAPEDGLVVLVTGATGSLGSHLFEHLSGLPQVKTIICFNRKSSASDPHFRQVQALQSRGIDTSAISKMEVVETDSTKPMLGLSPEQYQGIAAKVTHIVHNAWPMSGKRPLKGFEAQFKMLRNLLDLTSAAASAQSMPIGFQFVSSIAVVGHYPLLTGDPLVPEERMETVAAVLPNGYGDAKWACELMLDETLHRSPQHFRAMSVRLGQIAGSRTSGYWNHMEHFTFLMRSSQTLGAFPDLEGVLSWTPVNDVAATLGDLLLLDDVTPCPFYHVDNPVRQPWSEMVSFLADGIGAKVIPFQEWVSRVRNHPDSSDEWENPASKLVDFFDHDYTRMSCGGLLLGTAKACEHSRTLSAVGPVRQDTARMYIEAWKAAGALK